MHIIILASAVKQMMRLVLSLTNEHEVVTVRKIFHVSKL